MKKNRSIWSDNIPVYDYLSACLKPFGLMCALLCLFFSCNAFAYVDIIPPGHRPASSADQEDIRSLPEQSLFDSPFSVAIENMAGLNVILTPLIRYWMPSFGPGGDHMTSVKGGKEDLPQGTVNQGILYYVNANPGENTIPLYRLLSEDQDSDHMASNFVDEPGYRPEAFLGYPFASTGEAMAPIKRMVKEDPLDHLTAFYGETIENYTEDGVLGYGYPRFGEKDGEGKVHNPFLMQIAYNGVTVNADLSWGGVIYELWWNGKQFVNHNDCGREIQTALFKPGLGDNEFGPTEAGDRMFHGSPVAEFQVKQRSIYTRSLPLQWDPRSYGGGASNPVLYGGEFDRRAKFVPHPTYKILRYTVGYKPAETAYFMREWVTAYLNLDVTERFFLETAIGGMEELPMPTKGEYFTRSMDEGAIVVSSADLGYALGFFTSSPAYASWYNFEGQSTPSESTRKINLWDTDAYMTAGEWHRRTVFLLVGSLDDVQGGIAFLRKIQRFFPGFVNGDKLPEAADAVDNSLDW